MLFLAVLSVVVAIYFATQEEPGLFAVFFLFGVFGAFYACVLV